MLAALHAKNSGHGGAYLDISMTESMLSWQYLPLLADTSQRAASLLNGGAACYNIYQCSDEQFISLGAIETGFWKNFCEAVDRPQWISHQYDDMPQRELIDEVAAVIATENREHWRQKLDPVDCCFEVLFTPGELAQHAQFQIRHALDADGPTYPAWIDQQALTPPKEVEELASNDELRWRSAKPD